MKIAVCFKAQADYGRLPPANWKWDQDHFVDTGFVRRVFNHYDESALELGLKLSSSRKKRSTETELTAITVDDEHGDLFLKHLTALGYHHAVRIHCIRNRDLRFDSLAISGLIAAYIKQGGHQLVLLGIQGGEGDNQQTGPLVAERLGWPCIGQVTEVIEAESPDCLKVSSRIDKALLIQTVRLPLVLTIGNALNSPCLRFPTLKQKLLARNSQPIIVSDRDLGLDPDTWTQPDKTLMELHPPPKKQPCVFLEGETPRIQAQRLYEHYLKERLGP